MDYPYDRLPPGWTVADYFRECYRKDASAKNQSALIEAVRKLHASVMARHAPMSHATFAQEPHVRIHAAVPPDLENWPASVALEVEQALHEVGL